jgi:hypothetical protein
VAEVVLSPRVFSFPMLIVIPPLLYTHLSPLPQVRDSTDQAAHDLILVSLVRGLTFDPVLSWLHSKELECIRA